MILAAFGCRPTTLLLETVYFLSPHNPRSRFAKKLKRTDKFVVLHTCSSDGYRCIGIVLVAACQLISRHRRIMHFVQKFTICSPLQFCNRRKLKI